MCKFIADFIIVYIALTGEYLNDREIRGKVTVQFSERDTERIRSSYFENHAVRKYLSNSVRRRKKKWS